MEPLKILVLVLSACLILFGIAALLGTWLAPSFMDRRFMRHMLTGWRLEPSRSNRVLMSIWATLIGGYLALAMLEFRMASLVVLAAWLPFAFVVLKRTWRSPPTS